MHYTDKKLKNQEGVTLLVSVLILSGMAVITAAVAFFAIQEIRASRAILYTEPAISAAQGGGELGLWQIKRNKTLSTCGTTPETPVVGNAKVEVCTSYDEVTFDMQANVDFKFYLYNPESATNSELLDYFTSLYITNRTSTTLTVEIRRIDSTTPISTGTVAVNQTRTFNNISAISGQEGRLEVTLKPTSAGTVVADTNRGIPGFPIVDSSACIATGSSTTLDCNSQQETFKRRLNITVPK